LYEAQWVHWRFWVNRGSVLLSRFQSHDLGTLHRSAVRQIDSG